MTTKTAVLKSKQVSKGTVSPKVKVKGTFVKFSPSWVVYHINDAPGFKLELIESIVAKEKEFEIILPTFISSMQKKKIYGRETSERIYEISRLFGLGYEVFDSPEYFKEWLLTPSKTLGNKKPFELLDSSFGFELVVNEIIRIQYNVYS